MKVRKEHALLCKLVESGSRDPATIKLHVAASQVVGENDHDVRWSFRKRDGWERRRESENEDG